MLCSSLTLASTLQRTVALYQIFRDALRSLQTREKYLKPLVHKSSYLVQSSVERL